MKFSAFFPLILKLFSDLLLILVSVIKCPYTEINLPAVSASRSEDLSHQWLRGA